MWIFLPQGTPFCIITGHQSVCVCARARVHVETRTTFRSGFSPAVVLRMNSVCHTKSSPMFCYRPVFLMSFVQVLLSSSDKYQLYANTIYQILCLSMFMSFKPRSRQKVFPCQLCSSLCELLPFTYSLLSHRHKKCFCVDLFVAKYFCLLTKVSLSSSLSSNMQRIHFVYMFGEYFNL